MSETNTLSQPATLILPIDILLKVILGLLAPVFLSACNGDLNIARMAALQTLKAYRARNQAELIAVAQIIACSLAAVDSIRLSLADETPGPMRLRLRGNAVALNRVVKQNQLALQQTAPDNQQSQQAAADTPPNPDQMRYEADVMASVAASQKMAAEAVARLQPAAPARNQCPAQSPAQPPAGPPAQSPVPPAPIPATPTTATPTPATPTTATPAAATPAAAAIQTAPTTALCGHPVSDQEWQMHWAAAMVDVAAEFTTELDKLPPKERLQAFHRAAALSNCATELLAGDAAKRPQPGDLDALMRAAKG